MDIQWKQQHINNACVPACVAMLLSQYEIQKEDFEIILESKRPYLIEFNEDDKSFSAGVLIQSPQIMNIVPNKFNLKIIHNEFDNFGEYYAKVKKLLENNIAFLTSLAQGFIPSIGYKQNKSKRGHAIVVHKIENDDFCVLDPDGGINRKEENKFEEVEDFVSYNIHKNELQRILEVRNKFIIAYMEKSETNGLTALNSLNKSQKILKEYSQIFQKEALSIINEDGSVIYNDFYDFIIRIIKPIALDLKNALLTIPNPSKNELSLITKLENLFQNTLDIQKKLKENPHLIIKPHFDSLLIQVETIQQTALIIIGYEIQKL